MAAQGRALALARGLQLIKRLMEARGHGRLQLRLGLGIRLALRGFDHAAQGQQAIQGRGRDATLGDPAGAGGQIEFGLLQVDPQRRLAFHPSRLKADRDLPALESSLSPLPGGAVKGVQTRRASEANLQIAAIDRSRLHRPGPVGQCAVGPAKAGHSRKGHCWSPSWLFRLYGSAGVAESAAAGAAA